MIQKEDILFLRVSKEEKNLQEIEPQKKAILNKFNLKEKNCKIISERGSAYNLNKLHKRKGYLELLDILFNSKITTLEDIFLTKYTKKDINLYVWDYHRIMRNFEFNLLFGLICIDPCRFNKIF